MYWIFLKLNGKIFNEKFFHRKEILEEIDVYPDWNITHIWYTQPFNFLQRG
jgi:hypothetical protein